MDRIIKGPIALRLGPHETVLADVEEFDALITDTPYSERTHKGHNAGDEMITDGVERQTIEYTPWRPMDVCNFVHRFAPRCRGWFVAMTSHDLISIWEKNLEELGRYVFAPLPAVMPGMTVRRAGDGPSSWTIWIIVARPKTVKYSRWGALPGGYRGSPQAEFPGGKPLWLMRALFRDYTRPGDLICDPCAGTATTLIAAAIEGRRGLGAECDRATYEKAKRRIEAGWTPTLF